MDRKIFFYGIYAAVIVATGGVAFFLHIFRTGAPLGELSQPIDQIQVGIQLCVFAVVSVLALLTYRDSRFCVYFQYSLVAVLFWYCIFEVFSLGWMRELSIPRVVASAFCIVLPTAYVLVSIRRERI